MMTPEEARRLIRKLADDAAEAVFEAEYEGRAHGDELRALRKLERTTIRVQRAGGMTKLLAVARQRPEAVR